MTSEGPVPELPVSKVLELLNNDDVDNATEVSDVCVCVCLCMCVFVCVSVCLYV